MEQVTRDFTTFLNAEIVKLKALHSTYRADKNTRLVSDLYKKFPFLKSKSCLPTLDEIIQWESTKKQFPKRDIDELLSHFISKIRGLFKHGQTEKTFLCNMRILANVKNGYLTIAIAKNTLNAKEQWEERLIKSLKELLPGVSLKDRILVISSKKNDLNGNATHCKTIAEAFAHYARGHFKIIFVCSNAKRISDILEFLSLYTNLATEKRVPIDIQQDEAHNLEEGVPSKRESIEHIVMNPYVESYVPVTASYEPLIVVDNTACLWKRVNLDAFAIDYTKNSDTVSNSEDYSSISDSHQLTFETIKAHPSYKDHGIEEFDEDTFLEADSKDYTSFSEAGKLADIERRRKLEFCHFMKFEKEALNIFLNYLDNYHHVSYREGNTVIETPLILPDQLNTHIVTTPLRVAFTITGMKYAIKQSYNPICIGLYNGGIYIMYKNSMGQIIHTKFSDLIEECSSEEVNTKIYAILEHLLKEGETIKRPVLIMGNYKPTGESITFVNYKYGTIRSDMLLPIPGLTKEKSYQGFLRSCYKDTKFKEHDPAFVHPPKWIIGSQASINDALFYEKQNDDRIYRLKEGIASGTALTPVVAASHSTTTADSSCSIPIKLTILDMEDKYAVRLHDIFDKVRRSKDDKQKVLKYIKKMIDNGAVDWQDPTGTFNITTYTLKDIRTYKSHTPEENEERKREKGIPYEADYRFREYDSKHRNRMPYINNKGEIGPNECELLVAFDKYIYDGFTNQKTIMWLSYRLV